MKKRRAFNPLERNLFHFSEFRDGFKAFSNNKHKQISFLTGFTLIELLVVIAIIVILMAILIPVASRVKKQARNVICQSRLKQWSMIMMVYIDSNNGNLPNNSKYSEYFLFGSDLLNNPVNNADMKDMRLCPSAVRTSYDTRRITGRGNPYFYHPEAFTAWEILCDPNTGKTSWGGFEDIYIDFNRYKIVTGSYAFNQSLFNSFLNPNHGSSKYKDLNVYNLKGTSNIPVILDSYSPLTYFNQNMDPPPEENGYENPSGFCINRHEGGVNSLFMDFSVRKVGLKELWKLKWHKDFDTNGPWTKAGGVQPQDWPQWMRSFKDY